MFLLTWINYSLLYALLSRGLYVWYVTAVEKRALAWTETKTVTKRKNYPYGRYTEEVTAWTWDTWTMFPVLGDLLLFCFIPGYLAKLLNYYTLVTEADKEERSLVAT